MEKTKLDDRIFVGINANGISFSNRIVIEKGDYSKMARYDFKAMKLVIEDLCHPTFATQIRNWIREQEYKKGQSFQVSTCGQSVNLGE